MNYPLYAYYLFAAFYVIFLPSYSIGRTLYPRERLALRLGLGLVFTFTVMPVLCFGLAMALSTNINEVLIFTVASVITLVGLVVQYARAGKKTRQLEE